MPFAQGTADNVSVYLKYFQYRDFDWYIVVFCGGCLLHHSYLHWHLTVQNG